MSHAHKTFSDDYITVSTIARRADRSESTIRLWQRKGVLVPAARTASGIALYRRDDVERALAGLGITPEPEAA
jgi:hypothetical protein